VLARLFRRAQHPWQSQAIPATDGKHLWLPADSCIEDIERGHEHYRIMALQQAIRAQRGSASFIDGTLSPLQADVYLLLEAWAVDETLVEMLPGMGSAIEHLRRQALRQRPLLSAFSPARQPLESLLRQLLASPCGRAPEDFPLSESPAHSQRLIDPVLSTLGLSPQDCSLGNAPLLLDCWTGHLFRPSNAAEGLENAPTADGQTSIDTAPPRSAHLPRRPDIRNAAEDEDKHDEGVFMVQADEPHQHAEDPLGLSRPVDHDEDTSADEYGDMLSELPEARLVSTPGRPKEVLISDDPPDSNTALQLKRAIADGQGLSYPEWDYHTGHYRQPGAIVRVLSQGFLEQDHTTDVLSQPRRSENQVAVVSSVFFGGFHTNRLEPFGDGWVALVRRQNALTFADQFTDGAFKLFLSVHPKLPSLCQ
jgi:nitric oxide reductase NorD protein